MNKEGFSAYLKKLGKKSHVIEGLACQVVKFQEFLLSNTNRQLETACVDDIDEYSTQLENQKPGFSRKGIRGLALYYRFIGKDQLAQAAVDIREDGIAKQRHSFPLCEFQGVSQENISILENIGIVNTVKMLEMGATEQARRELVERTGIPMTEILVMVKLSDLSRISGVKSIRARLYHDAGIDTVEKLAAQVPENLLQVTADFVKRTGFPGIAPLPKEVRSTIQVAKMLPKIVTYEEG